MSIRLEDSHTLMSIIYDKNRYNATVSTINMLKADIITDLIDNVDENFKWIKEKLITLEPVRFGHYNDCLECVIDKNVLSSYYCDFSSICELGIYISEADIKNYNKYKYRYSLDLDRKEVRIYDNDNKTSLSLSRKDLEGYLRTTLFKSLF